MFKRILQMAAIALLIIAGSPAMARDNANQLVIPLADQTRLFLRELAPGYVLSVRRQASTNGGTKGWGLEVLRRPITADAANLLEGKGPLMVLAGGVVDRKSKVRYPRTLDVSGTDYRLKIHLDKAKVQGTGPDAVFTQGDLRLEWSEK